MRRYYVEPRGVKPDPRSRCGNNGMKFCYGNAPRRCYMRHECRIYCGPTEMEEIKKRRKNDE